MQRKAMLERMAQDHVWDLIVIGGGATGLGTALDAVSRGYSTVLVEAADFAKGTSSRSTKLIHGGVRYLRSGQIGMVRESLRERGLLLKNAPKITHAIRFAIPAYRRGEAWYYWAGMKAYDLLAGSLGLEPARLLSGPQMRQALPGLDTQKLRGGVLYSDGQFDDARLALGIAQTLATQGGVLANYLPVQSLVFSEERRCTGVVVQDLEAQHTFELRGRAIVNATGVFAESIMKLEEAPSKERPRIRPSQGTHIVLSGEFLPGELALLIPDTDDGRVLFAIPWLGHTLVGTTDHAVGEILVEPRPQMHEVEYLLEHIGRYLQKQPKLCDVQSVFSGLRPLVARENQQGTAGLSREHEIYTSPSGLISVVGGKWTTYRKMGQDVIDLAADVGGLPKRASKTHRLRLDDELVGGSVAERSLAYQRETGWSQPLHPELPYIVGDVYTAIRSEMARTLDDVLARRTRALLLNARACMQCAPQVASLLAAELQRDAAWREQQLQEFLELAQNYCVYSEA